MFSVYGTSGKIYTGGLEQVRDLGPVQAVARVRGAAAVGRQEAMARAAWLAAGGGSSGGAARPAPAPQSHVAHEALAAYAAPARQPLTQVQQLMSRDPIGVPAGATLRQAWAVLVRADVGQAPVLGAMGEVRGLVTRADLLRGLPEDLAQAALIAQRLDGAVEDFMWTPIPVALPETPLRQAAQLMLDLHLPGLPVADERGVLLGFLSRSDLLRGMTHEPPLDLWS